MVKVIDQSGRCDLEWELFRFLSFTEYSTWFYECLSVRFVGHNRYRRQPAVFDGAEHNVSFVEFVRFLTDRGLVDSDRFNPHWAPVSDLCRPCHVRYDYVIKLEAFDTEASRLWKALYGHGTPAAQPSTIHRNARALRTSSDVTVRYLRQLSRRQVRRLVRLYADDFRLFDYSADMESFDNDTL